MADPGAAETISDLLKTPSRQRKLFSRAGAPGPALPTLPEASAVQGSPTGFSLEEVLRQNGGRLPAMVVANLLGPLGQIADGAGTAELDLTPGGVWIDAGAAGEPAARAVPFTDATLTQGWLGWLEVRPPDAARMPDPSDNETMPPARAGSAVAVAALAYELLGGGAPGSDYCYRDLPECSEEGNALLRSALEGGASEFADAVTFAAALGPALLQRPGEGVNAPPLAFRAKMRRRRSRSVVRLRALLKSAGAALAALALIAILGWWALGASRTPRRTPINNAASPKPSPMLSASAGPNEDYEMGLDLWNGMGHALIDQSQAVAHFQAAAAKGCAPAEAFLALIYQEGFAGVQKDELQAEKWAKASLAAGLREEAQQGDAEAQLRLGLLYDEGIGVKKDPEGAAQLYQKAAYQGNASAEFSLGICCFNGSGLEKDLARAVSLYQESADQGNAYAQNNLGFCCQVGIGVPQDMVKAADLYKKAAAQGNAIAQKNLGVCYFTGVGVEKDLAKAVELYQKAAGKGNALAEFNLGVCYESGAGVEKDLAKAVDLYKKAAAQGIDSAQYALGMFYEKGIGVQRDRDKAVEFYIKAADQGNNLAKGRLRSLLAEGAK